MVKHYVSMNSIIKIIESQYGMKLGISKYHRYLTLRNQWQVRSAWPYIRRNGWEVNPRENSSEKKREAREITGGGGEAEKKGDENEDQRGNLNYNYSEDDKIYSA